MRILYILIAFVIIFSLGCKKDKPESPKPNDIKPLLKSDVTDKTLTDAEKVLDKKLSQEKKQEIKDKAEEAAKKIKAEEIENIPQIKLDTSDVKLEWADGKGKVMNCLAKSFTGDQKTNMLSLSDFTATLYEQGKPSAKVQAKKAVLDLIKKEIKVNTGVKVVSLVNKTTLTANKVLWKSKENTIYAQEGILDSPYGKITGKYFTLDTKLEIFQVSDTGLNID